MGFGEKIASALHEDWRSCRKREDGTFEPRWKKIKDAAFVSQLDENNLPANIRKADNGYEIDIANTPYENLSADWQEENRAAGEVVGTLLTCGYSVPLEEVGDYIHMKWLERNEWAKGGELDVPYKDLPLEEQMKDIRQYMIGQKVLEQEKNNNNDQG